MANIVPKGTRVLTCVHVAYDGAVPSSWWSLDGGWYQDPDTDGMVPVAWFACCEMCQIATKGDQKNLPADARAVTLKQDVTIRTD